MNKNIVQMAFCIITRAKIQISIHTNINVTSNKNGLTDIHIEI